MDGGAIYLLFTAQQHYRPGSAGFSNQIERLADSRAFSILGSV